jgi:hypothetical protein
VCGATRRPDSACPAAARHHGVMTDLSDAVRALLPPGDWRVTGELHGSNRSRVRRVGHGGDSLIVKEFTTSDEGWVRESAALSVLPPSAPAPRLVAAGGEPPIVVMADAGAGGDVAAALLAGDPAGATDAVLSWARAIADLHRSTAGLRGAFRAALDDRAGDFPVAESTVADDLDTAAGVIARHCADLGVTVPSGALDALRSLGGRLGGDGPAALTPADAWPCPGRPAGVPGGSRPTSPAARSTPTARRPGCPAWTPRPSSTTWRWPRPAGCG